jgi:hypothetical protein
LLPPLCPGSGMGSAVCEGVKKAVATAANVTAAIATITSRRSLSIVLVKNEKKHYNYAADRCVSLK